MTPRPTTMAEARARIQSEAARLASTTLAEQWQAYANATLPSDCSTAQVIRARRDWYFEQLERLGRMTNRGAHDEALFQEALGFGRALGTAAERAAA